MIPLETTLPAPPGLDAFVAAHSTAGPGEFDSLELQPVKAAVKARRNVEQDGLCIYCERRLGPTEGHVEHIHPKGGPSGDPARTFVYANLAQSCDGDAGGTPNRHCGQRKGGGVLPVPPGAGCNEPFSLSTDGTILPDQVSTLTKQRRHQLTSQINQLGLNEPALKQEREGWVRTVQAVMSENDAGLAEFLAEQPLRYTLARLGAEPLGLRERA